MASHIYGMHDWDPAWGAMVSAAGKTAWCPITKEIGADPGDHSGDNYMGMVGQGITPIVRLNFSHHGAGTIPDQNLYENFAERCVNYANASLGCTRWIIGNEPNVSAERPASRKGQVLPASFYVSCYALCQERIKSIAGSGPTHEVLMAAVAPYNVESGWSLDYFHQMINSLGSYGVIPDGFALHTYGRGPDPTNVTSETKMDPPFQDYYNGFRAYRDFLKVIPPSMRSLPVYITETDQNAFWQNSNTGWVQAAYREIDDWNQGVGNQKIQALCLYRWSTDDNWQISTKNGVIADFDVTLRGTNFLSPKPVPATPQGPVAVVNVPAGANLRTGPSTSYPKPITAVQGAILKVVGRNADSSWWQVDMPVLGKLWVSATTVFTQSVQNVPVVLVTEPASPAVPVTKPSSTSPTTDQERWSRSLAFVLAEEGGYQNVDNDAGNWTGGKVGVGDKKGTKFGISAASYPDLDIPNLTVGQATDIYRRDYWIPSGAAELPWPNCLLVMDTAVLHGVGTAQKWLAEVGPNAYIFAARRLESYTKQDNWNFWGAAWVNRVSRLLKVMGAP